MAGSQVLWNMQNTTMPVQVGAWAAKPDGSEVFELLPFEGAYWLEPDYGIRPIGSQHLGYTLLPPMPAEQPLTYPDQGRTMVEQIYTCHFSQPPAPGAVTQINWGLTRTFTFRAAKEAIEGLRPQYWTMGRGQRRPLGPGRCRSRRALPDRSVRRSDDGPDRVHGFRTAPTGTSTTTSNAKYVWTDGQGGFVGSDDANFDPNLGADRTWTQAGPA